MRLISLLSAVTFAIPVLARLNGRHGLPKILPVGHTLDATIHNATFDQLLDHEKPELGTFKQTYWYSKQFWQGPGSPVVLFTPGEVAATGYTGYLTNKTITGLYAQELGGLVVLIEHRYWGSSSPYEKLTTKNLQYLTLKNSIADLTYFANNVKFSFDSNGSTNAQNAPWVLSGGSYSGALAAWTASTSPGTFWAYHASSAPVEAIFDYWQYFDPVQQGMPKNCSTDVSLVIDYIDQTLKTGNSTAKSNLKAKFGLAGVSQDADFASVLQNGPWSWQSNSFTTGYSEFYQFCDAVENVVSSGNGTYANQTSYSTSGVGLEQALAGYAAWVNASVVPGYCQDYGYPNASLYSVECFDTYNPENAMFTDVTVLNIYDRQWVWLLCNEPFAYWQDGAPANTSTIVSRLVDGAYWQRQCPLFFPDTEGYTYGSNTSAPAYTTSTVNEYTKGWDLPQEANESTRLIWTNGEFDPWRTSGVSSVFRDGGEWLGSEDAPVQVIPGGFHCSDLILTNAAANPGVQTVVDNEVKQIYEWVQEFYQDNTTKTRRRSRW